MHVRPAAWIALLMPPKAPFGGGYHALADAASSPARAAAAAASTATASSATTPTATPAGTATSATAAAADDDGGFLNANAEVFLVEQVKRGEADVGHFFLAQKQATIGRGVSGVPDIRNGCRGCRSVPHQRKAQPGGSECRGRGGLVCAVLLRSLLPSWHGRVLFGFTAKDSPPMCPHACNVEAAHRALTQTSAFPGQFGNRRQNENPVGD
jgi:hypothetical protein